MELAKAISASLSGSKIRRVAWGTEKYLQAQKEADSSDIKLFMNEEHEPYF